MLLPLLPATPSSKLAKAELFKMNILRLRRLVPFPAYLKAQLEKVQLFSGKGILGLRASTAGPVVYTELGFKPIAFLLLDCKVRFAYLITWAD